MILKKNKKHGFTLVELVVVILVIAILATATFLGGATVIKQARLSKVKNNLRNYAVYVQDMLYAEPGIANKTEGDVKTLLNEKYLTKDFQIGTTKDVWNNIYEFKFATNTVDSHKCTYIIINSCGSNNIDESTSAAATLSTVDYLSAQAALDTNVLTTGDDLGAIILLRDGAVSTANYGFEGKNINSEMPEEPETPESPVVVTMLEGNNQTYTGTSPIVFRSSAPKNTLKEVKVDDTVVDSTNYTVGDGSTIITFNDVYSRMLANGNHTIDIISNDGTATAGFTVNLSLAPGLYVSGTRTLQTIDGQPATWENLKAAYPNAFATAGTVAANSYTSYLTSLSGDLVISNEIEIISDYAFRNCKDLISITIPDGVTSIGRCAFNSCTGLTSITIPNGVTTIGDSVFNNCTKLTSITLPESITSMGDMAFNNCIELKSIIIPCNVSSIAGNAFKNCQKLTSINVNSNNSNYTSENGVLFNKNKTTLIAYPTASGDYTIPNGVTAIGNNAFDSCVNLTSVTILNGVTSIGNSAFYSCTGITTITIPNSVTTIGNSVFNGCTNLTTITMPNDITSIGEYAFWNCSKLTTLTIPSNVTTIGKSAFYCCSSLKTIIIPDAVKTIGDTVFWECSNLTSITFNGTQSQWSKIVKGNVWKYNVPSSCIVQCTNGNITIDNAG